MRRLCAILLVLLAGALQAQTQTLPPLNLDAPQGFAGGGQEVATFTATDGDMAIHVYPFRRMGPGEFQARFRETLLREFVAAGLREKAAGAVQIQSSSVEGAEAAFTGRFSDGGHERSRLAIYSGGAVAIVDITAHSGAAMERHAVALKEMLDSLSVGQPKARAAPPPVLSTAEVAVAPPAPAAPVAPQAATAPASAPPVSVPVPAAAPAPAPAVIPGLYVGNVRRLIPSFVGGVQSGGMWVTGPQYFVLSREGLAHRNYIAPRLPEGDASRFDWKRAQRDDPADTGTYQVLGNELTLRLGIETIGAKLKGPAQFDILGNHFKRTTPR